MIPFIVEAGSFAFIITFVKSKLLATNPYLRDPIKRERAMLKSVESSSAIEGIRVSLRKSPNGAGKPASSRTRVKS
jgi:hypothetical protein